MVGQAVQIDTGRAILEAVCRQKERERGIGDRGQVATESGISEENVDTLKKKGNPDE